MVLNSSSYDQLKSSDIFNSPINWDSPYQMPNLDTDPLVETSAADNHSPVVLPPYALPVPFDQISPAAAADSEAPIANKVNEAAKTVLEPKRKRKRRMQEDEDYVEDGSHSSKKAKNPKQTESSPERREKNRLSAKASREKTKKLIQEQSAKIEKQNAQIEELELQKRNQNENIKMLQMTIVEFQAVAVDSWIKLDAAYKEVAELKQTIEKMQEGEDITFLADNLLPNQSLIPQNVALIHSPRDPAYPIGFS